MRIQIPNMELLIILLFSPFAHTVLTHSSRQIIVQHLCNVFPDLPNIKILLFSNFYSTFDLNLIWKIINFIFLYIFHLSLDNM